jgi:hypothetical protein
MGRWRTCSRGWLPGKFRYEGTAGTARAAEAGRVSAKPADEGVKSPTQRCSVRRRPTGRERAPDRQMDKVYYYSDGYRVIRY